MPPRLRGTLRVADPGRARQALGGGVVHSPTASADREPSCSQQQPLAREATNTATNVVPDALDFFGIDGSVGVPDHCKEQLQLARRLKDSMLWEDYNLAFREEPTHSTRAEQLMAVAKIPDDQTNELWLFARPGDTLRCAVSVPVVPTHKACALSVKEYVFGPETIKYKVIALGESALDTE